MKLIEKLIRKANLFLLQNKNISNLIIDELYLDKFLGNSKTHDVNFLNLVKNYDLPGTALTVDLRGYLVKILIRKKVCPKEVEESIQKKILQAKKITTKDILHKINPIVKLEKHVEEALQISINLAKYKLVDLYNQGFAANNSEILGDYLSEYNLYLSMPYQKKEGNSYGLAFYISLLSAVLNIKIQDSLSKSLIVGELSPFGNALKVREINRSC